MLQVLLADMVEESHTGHAHLHGAGAGKKLGWVILANAAITVAEFVAGMISGSLALVSDSGHNLSDVLALILGYAGERAAHKRPTARFSFGLRRLEVLIALVNALSLVVIGVLIVLAAAERFKKPVEVQGGLTLIVALVGLLGNAVSILILHRHRRQNLNLKAVFLHLLFDTISSLLVVAVGVVLVFRPWYWLDLLASLAIVVMMVVSSAGIIAEAVRIFLQAAPGSIDPQEVRGAILALDEIQSVHGLHIWSVSSNEVFLSCHVCTGDPSLDTNQAILAINRLLAERFKIEHSTIQVETSQICTADGGGNCCR
jgi:cobalt-zinc-cadmium efflux system protein